MTDLLPVERDDQSLELDPVGYMSTVLHRAKSWLDEAQSIDDVRNAKAIAVGYENVIREKEMAFDAQLAATEIVRRCERRVGELVKKGQADGTIRSMGETAYRQPVGRNQQVGVAEAAGVKHRADLVPIRKLAEATPQEFDQAIEEAKAEGNLSRANVVRKVKGDAPKPPGRSEWHRKKRHFDSNRIVRETVLSLNGLCSALEYVQFDVLDPVERLEWISSLDQSMKVLNRFHREVKK